MVLESYGLSGIILNSNGNLLVFKLFFGRSMKPAILCHKRDMDDQRLFARKKSLKRCKKWFQDKKDIIKNLCNLCQIVCLGSESFLVPLLCFLPYERSLVAHIPLVAQYRWFHRSSKAKFEHDHISYLINRWSLRLGRPLILIRNIMFLLVFQQFHIFHTSQMTGSAQKCPNMVKKGQKGPKSISNKPLIVETW